jgi:hypothetical protein
LDYVPDVRHGAYQRIGLARRPIHPFQRQTS